MNDLDTAIVATLRAEAREAGMRTSTPQQYELLSSRLDAVDRSRTRTRWLAVAAAVVLVGGTAWAVTSAQQTSTAPPATTPSPSGPGAVGMTYMAVEMDPDTRVTLPGWTSSTDIWWNSPRGPQFEQGQCAEPLGAPACADDEDVKLRLETLVAYYPASAGSTAVTDPSYGDFLGHLDSLAGAGVVTISDRSEATVAGRPATLVTLSVATDAPGVMGCPRPTSVAADCYPLVGGRDMRLAIVDQGSGPPTLFYVSVNAGAADQAERFAELDAMLSTVEFG